MGRSRTITDEQILEAARQIFLSEGFGASTVDIARRAGISEGSIFKRFSTKENLFFAAMGISALPGWMAELETLVGTGNLKENLMVLALQMLDFFQEVLPRMIMMISKGNPPLTMPPPQGSLPFRPMPAADTPHSQAIDFPPGDLMPLKELKALTRFFERELELKRIGSCNPEILAYMLLGAIIHYIFLQQMRGNAEPSIDPQTYVRGVVDTLWRGIAP